MNLVFFGTSRFGLPALDALAHSAHTVLAVVTQSDKPAGRKLAPRSSPVKQWAAAHSVRTLELSRSAEEALARELERLHPDLFVVISFGKLLKKRLLDIPKIASVNVHASLLPRWRGASPMQSAILAGDAETGVSVMRMAETLDTGDVLLSKRLPIDPRETIETLEPKLSSLGASALIESLAELERGDAHWTPQNERRATHCVKIKKEDGRLRWTEPAEMLDREVRAFLSWPGSFTFFGGKRVLVKQCRVAPAPSGASPGRVLEAGPDGISVAAASGALVLESLQLEGRNAMPVREFLKGFSLKPGDIFE